VLCKARSSSPKERSPRGNDYSGERRLYGKNLQNAIKNSNSVNEILSIVAENESFLDHIHCVTAIYRMAKLTQSERRRNRGNKGGQQINLLNDDRFEVLKSSIESQINKFDSWATANLLYSFALLRCNPGYSLLDLLTGHAVSLGGLLSTVDVSNAFWAFSQLKYKPHPNVVQELWDVAAMNVSLADFRSIAGLLESSVKMGHKPSTASLTTINEYVMDNWIDITARETANVFISFVRLGYVPSKEFLMATDAKIQNDFDDFSNRDIALCLSAFRLAKHKPSEKTFAQILMKVNANFHDFHDRDIVQILYSFCKMNVDPGLENLNKVSDNMVSNPNSCTSESTLRMLDAYVSAGYQPSEEFIGLAKQKNKKTNARSGQLIRRF